jgi:hypothetical protein
MRKSYLLLALVALALAALAPTAMADDKTAVEKAWSSLPPNVVLADVAEVEPNNSLATAQVLGCGNVLRPASIAAGSPPDTDYVSFTAIAGTVVTIGTDADGTTGQLGDSRIRLFDANGVVLASDDDSGPGLYSLITYTLTSSGTFYVGFAGYSSSYTGIYKGFINCQAPEPPPVNDVCAGAIPIQCGSFSLAGSTVWATNDYTPLASGSGGCTGYTALGKDVVYLLNVAAGDSVHIVYTTTADGSVYIITDCSDPIGTCVAGSDATLSGQAETLDYTFAAAGLYYLILDSYGTDTSGTWTAVGDLICHIVPTDRVSWGKVKTIYR